MPNSLWNDEIDKPLQHLRVIDLSVMLPGSFLTRLMAQYGADVIKIEAIPNGDPLRETKDTALFELLNQGKRSVALNLKTELGVSILKGLAGEADIFVENFKEGVMDRLGIGYADISEENPDLIYLSLRGLSGKHSAQASHDLNFISASGCGEWFLESGTPNYSTQFGDLVAGGLIPALKLMFHLANPARQGMHLVSYMDEAFRTIYLPRAYDTYKAENADVAERKNYGLQKKLNGQEPHSRYYKCRDGQWIALNAVQTKHWETFCEVVDRKEWKPRQSDPTLVPDVEKLFLDAPSTYWEALVTSRETCLFRVVPWAEHFSFSQARPQLATDPMTWAGFAPNAGLRPAPALGADTFSVVHSIGLSNKEISEAMKDGVLWDGNK